MASSPLQLISRFCAVLDDTEAEQKKFIDARIIEGRITALRHAPGGSGGHYPTVEYEHLGRKSVFTNDLTIHGARVGQRIDIQITPDGDARIETVGNRIVQHIIVQHILFWL